MKYNQRGAMMMKVFAKGQVVIPSDIRRKLGIDVGDYLNVELDEQRGALVLRRARPYASRELAGSLAAYRRGKKFPSRKAMKDALAKGLAHGS